MIRFSFFVLLVVLFLSACANKEGDPRHKEIREVAERSYGHLISSDVDSYLASLYDYSDMPEEYRSQMRDLLAQYVETERKAHKGLMGAIAVGDTILDSLNAVAFVEITFGDDTKETVSLPMRLSDGKWLLK